MRSVTGLDRLTGGTPQPRALVTRCDAIEVDPMPLNASICIATVVAERRSPPTPTELSPSKNMRSPASDATRS